MYVPNGVLFVVVVVTSAVVDVVAIVEVVDVLVEVGKVLVLVVVGGVAPEKIRTIVSAKMVFFYCK